MEHNFDFYRQFVIEPLDKCRRRLTENGALEHEYELKTIESFLKKICDENGYDVVATVFSIHIREQSYDGRYTPDVKKWADSYQTKLPIEGMPEDFLHVRLLGDTHPVVINSTAQILIERENELNITEKKEEEREQKPTAVEELYDKMSASQDKFREWILGISDRENILHHAFEYVIREDILMCAELGDISESDAKELLKKDDPLGDIFDKYQDTETSYMDEIRNAIKSEAKDVKKSDIEIEKN